MLVDIVRHGEECEEDLPVLPGDVAPSVAAQPAVWPGVQAVGPAQGHGGQGELPQHLLGHKLQGRV